MMTKRTVFFVTLMALLAIVTASAASAAKIVVEAENYSKIVPSMAKETSQVASGNGYIHVPLQRPHGTTEGAPGDTGYALYKVKITQAGAYNFWGRAHWYDGCGNSFFLKVDDKPAVVFGNDGTYQRWHWVKGLRLSLSAGIHTIKIQNREDGAKLDQFMLTTNSRYVPVRAEKQTPEYIVK